MIDERLVVSPMVRAMSSPSTLVRQEHLRSLGALAGILALADRRPETGVNGPIGPQPASGFAGAIAGECVQCGMRITGEELLALAPGNEDAPASGSAVNPKVARLRLGYCARSGCECRYYRITFESRPGVDWAKVLPPTELEAAPSVAAEDPGAPERQAAMRSTARRAGIRAGLVVLVVAMLWLARHWYQGGTIPLLREPEEFQVEVPRPPPHPGHTP